MLPGRTLDAGGRVPAIFPKLKRMYQHDEEELSPRRVGEKSFSSFATPVHSHPSMTTTDRLRQELSPSKTAMETVISRNDPTMYRTCDSPDEKINARGMLFIARLKNAELALNTEIASLSAKLGFSQRLPKIVHKIKLKAFSWQRLMSRCSRVDVTAKANSRASQSPRIRKDLGPSPTDEMSFDPSAKRRSRSIYSKRGSPLKGKRILFARKSTMIHIERVKMPEFSLQLKRAQIGNGGLDCVPSPKVTDFVKRKARSTSPGPEKTEQLLSSSVLENQRPINVAKRNFPKDSQTVKLIKEMKGRDPLFCIMKTVLQKGDRPAMSDELMHDYTTQCVKAKELPVPFEVSPTGDTLLISRARVGDKAARVIGRLFLHMAHTIERLVLVETGVSDEGLSEMLAGAYRKLNAAVTRLELREEAVGVKAGTCMARLAGRKPPEHLRELGLFSVKVPVLILNAVLEGLGGVCLIQRLSLNDLACDEISVDFLTKIIRESKKLYYLSMSKFGVTPAQTARILQAVGGSKSIEYLDLSYLPCGTQGEVVITETKQEIIRLLSSCIRNSERLVHLDLSHTRLVDAQALELAKAMKKSPALSSVHFSGNALSGETVTAVLRILGGVPLLRPADTSAPFGCEKAAAGKEEPVAAAGKCSSRPPDCECVFWRAKGMLGCHFADTWMGSTQCFICDHWRYTLFACRGGKDGHLSCSTYPQARIPLVPSSQYCNTISPSELRHPRVESLCKFAERKLPTKPHFVLPQESIDLSPEAMVQALMLPPHVVSYSIVSSENTVLAEGTVEVMPRWEEVRGPAAQKARVRFRRFVKCMSVFKDWREDTEEALRRMVQLDYGKSKLAKLIKTQKEQEELLELVYKNVRRFKEQFLEAITGSAYPNISWLNFTTYFRNKNMIDEACTMSDLDRFFIAVNVNLDKKDITTGKAEDNPDRALCRYEYLEILVRIANRKYRESGRAAGAVDSMRMLLKAMFTEHDDPEIHGYRLRRVWTLPVDDLLRGNLEELKTVFARSADATKRFVDLGAAIELVRKRCGYMSASDLDITRAYGYSKMTVINEAANSAMYKRMVFCEFLEFVVRVADMVAPKCEDEAIDVRLDAFLTRVLERHKLTKRAPAVTEESDEGEEAVKSALLK